MTSLTIPKGEESIPVKIDHYGIAKAEDAELQANIDMLLALYAVKPIVNREPWTARILANYFGGTITSEPPFDPNVGDVR